MSDSERKPAIGSTGARDDSSRPVVPTAANSQSIPAPSHAQTVLSSTQKRKRAEVDEQVVYAGGAEENLSIRMPLITRDQNPVAVVSASTVQGMENQQPALTEVIPVTGMVARRVISASRSQTTSRATSPASTLVDQPTVKGGFTDRMLETSHWLLSHGNFNVKLMEQLIAYLDWIGPNGSLKLTAVRDVEPTSKRKKTENPPRAIDTRDLVIQDNRLYGHNMVTNEQTSWNNPIASRGQRCAIWSLKDDMPKKGDLANVVTPCSESQKCQKLVKEAKRLLKEEHKRPMKALRVATNRWRAEKESHSQTQLSYPVIQRVDHRTGQVHVSESAVHERYVSYAELRKDAVVNRVTQKFEDMFEQEKKQALPDRQFRSGSLERNTELLFADEQLEDNEWIEKHKWTTEPTSFRTRFKNDRLARLKVLPANFDICRQDWRNVAVDQHQLQIRQLQQQGAFGLSPVRSPNDSQMDITIAVDDQDFNKSISDDEMGTDDEVFSPAGEQKEVPRVEPSSREPAESGNSRPMLEVTLNESLSETDSQLVDVEHLDIQDDTDSNITISAEVTNTLVPSVIKSDDEPAHLEPLTRSSPKKKTSQLPPVEDSLVLNASPPRTVIDGELWTPQESQQGPSRTSGTTRMEDLGFVSKPILPLAKFRLASSEQSQST